MWLGNKGYGFMVQHTQTFAAIHGMLFPVHQHDHNECICTSLIPRPTFFAGRWKSEGPGRPGISCMYMRLIRHEIIIMSMINDVIIKTHVYM